MVRTALMIPEDLKQAAIAEARKRGVSFGEFVRQAMAAALDATRPRSGQDSLLCDRSAYRGAVPKDSSTRLDDYLYGDKP
ncbi:MAG: hypothetical protein HY553_08295 [Elusimicrobia bacterium]|nr:hypothetical protein [Elusimicrobiota bacterium]